MTKLDLKEIDQEKEESEILQLKDNVLPIGLAPLEDLFEFNDVTKKPKIEPTRPRVEECNIKTEQEPKMIKFSKSIPPTKKLKYIDLFKEFIEVFAWSYEDLKLLTPNHQDWVNN